MLFSEIAVGMHRLMIAEALQFPELAASFYESGPRGCIGLLGAELPGELSEAPNRAAARAHVTLALALLRLRG